MMSVIVKIAICCSYFTVGGLSTTNILRLLKGSTLHVYSSKCTCQNCGMKISVLNQAPIISYIACGGKCKKCKIPLPISALVLEVLVFVGMTLITALFRFSPLGVLTSFCYYEILKICYIIKYRRRENSFLSQYLLSFLSILFIFVLVEFMSCLLLLI